MFKRRMMAVLLATVLMGGSMATLAAKPADAQVGIYPGRPVIVITTWTLTALGVSWGTYSSLAQCHYAGQFLPFGVFYLCVPYTTYTSL